MNAPDPRRDARSEEDLLIHKFKKGERAAFDGLYNIYKTKILNYINRRIGDKGRAEELTQEVFINVYMSIAKYKPRGLFRAWIYTIASNLAKNELKRRSYQINISLSKPIRTTGKDIALEDVLTNKDLASESILEQSELKRDIEKVLQRISPLHREVLILCVIEGLSYDEAAQVLKINVKTVSSRLARARQRFIKEIKMLEKK